MFRFLDRPRRHHPALIGVLLALSFATKESTFITVFVAGTFFLVVLVVLAGPAAGGRCAPSASTPGAGGWPRSSASSRCCSRPSSPTRAGCGTASTPAWSTGSASTTSAAAASRGSSTASCCSGSSGRRWCSGPSATRRAAPPDAAARLPRVGVRARRSRSTRGRARSSRGWCCTRCCRWCCWPGSACRRSGSRAGRWYGAVGVAVAAAGVRVRRLRLVPRQRRAPRRPARAARLHPVLRGGQARRRPRASRWPQRAAGAGQPFTVTVDSAEGATFPYAWYFRDLAVGYIDLSDGRPPTPDRDVLILTQGRNDRLRRELPDYAGPRVPVPRLVGARLRRDVPGGVVALVHRAHAVEPDGRHAGVGLRARGRSPRRRPHRRCPRVRRRCSPSSSHLARPASP